MNVSKKLIATLLYIIALYAISLLAYTFHLESPLLPDARPLAHVSFTGEYSLNEGSSFLPLANQGLPDTSRCKKIILKGHFETELPKGTQLLLRIENIRVTIRKNSEIIYQFGKPGSYPSFSKSPGNIWDIFQSPGIYPNNQIEIELENVYSNNISSVYHDFMKNILIGDSGALFNMLLKSYGFTMVLGGVIGSIGFLLLLASIVLKLLKNPIPPKIFYYALFSIAGGVWFFIDFRMISLILPLGVFSNILSMTSLCLIMPLFTMYAFQFISGKSQIPLVVLAFLQLGFALFYLIAQGCGIYDGFHLLLPFIILYVVGVLCNLCVLLYKTIRTKNREILFLWLTSCLFLLTFKDIFDYLSSGKPDYSYTKLSFVLFFIIHFLYLVYLFQNSLTQMRRTRHLESELAQSRIAIAISQIQPHFLYNALTAIKQLCAIDPKRAEYAIGDFSSFLRGNLDSLTSQHLIPFDKELTHIKNYLALEQLRFGSRLRVEYDIQVQNFQLPSLSVQPLVENAVRYGITKKPQGGVILISTQDNKAEIKIIVKDTGVGFDSYKKPKEERSHIGIENVRNRLEAQCHGKLEIESVPGFGTTAIITIKKER